MRSNYKRLGDYSRFVDVRNKDLALDRLLGVSITKTFIESIANTVGTDFSNYKVVKKNQFAYGPVTSRNGDKISVALLSEDECIISSSYLVFEINDENQLLPDYLMLWFNRPEFDRYARYMSHGSVREIFSWDDMCDVELPVPSIDEQHEIVAAYKAIENRIALKKKINDNLVQSGISIIQKEVGFAALINKTQAEIDNIVLPDGWMIKSIAEYCADTKSGSTPSRNESDYWENGTIPWLKSGEVHNNITLYTEEAITPTAVKETSVKLLPPNTVLMAMYGVTAGEVGYLAISATTNQAICGMVCNSKPESAYLYFALIQNQEEASRLSNGGAQDNLSKSFIDGINLVVPDLQSINSFHLDSIVSQITLNTKEINTLEELKSIVLATMSSR